MTTAWRDNRKALPHLLSAGPVSFGATSGPSSTATPIGESGGNNLYGFAGNDPVNGVDVLGLTEADDFGRGGGGSSGWSPFLGHLTGVYTGESNWYNSWQDIFYRTMDGMYRDAMIRDGQAASRRQWDEQLNTGRKIDQFLVYRCSDVERSSTRGTGSSAGADPDANLLVNGTFERRNSAVTGRRVVLPGSGTQNLPQLAHAQIDAVLKAWWKYVKIDAVGAQRERLERLFAQAVLMRRANGKPALAIREIVRVLLKYAPHGITITLGWGADETMVHSTLGAPHSNSTVASYSSSGRPNSDEEIVRTIMHELLHASDRVRKDFSPWEVVDRHNEIYRIENQTNFDLGLPVEILENAYGKDHGTERYIGPEK